MGLPSEFVINGLVLADQGTLFGVRFCDMTRDELIAAAANGWKSHHAALEESIRRSQFQSELSQLVRTREQY
jgi:hypothetical protein